MMNNRKKYSAIILSAGKSTRMGVPKFSLRFTATSTFLENIINQYTAFGCEEIIVVLNPDGAAFFKQLKLAVSSKVKVVINQHPEWERFYSLKLAAKGLTNSTPSFVSNIDNPFINPNVLEMLAQSDSKADYINPTFNGRGGHPFLISEKIIVDLISEPKDEIHLKEFLGRYSKYSVVVDDDKVLANVNTNEEYIRLFGQN